MTVYCPGCKAENTADSKFCKECGTSLTSSDARQVAATKTLEIPSDVLTSGSTFVGRYRIIQDLGKGGMGRVYKAYDTEVNETVALKLIQSEIAADERTIERFRNELRLARKITHKNVCRMYDLNKGENTYFLTMEFIPGEDLKGFIRRSKQLTPATIISIATQISEGLSEAHRLGVVHRDLKPQNIMIDEEGKVRIMDFGIARSLKAKGVTRAGTVIGTPDYMSPEQAEGGEVDERSDIYSLGVVLYEMATGRLPFEGDTALSVAIMHREQKPKDPQEVSPQVPESLGRIILKCLEKTKDRRYSSADELLSDLTRSDDPNFDVARPTEWKKSIAVLPFQNMSADPEQEFFCDGLAEELINALAQIRDLRVVARTSAFSFKGKDIDIRDVGSQLNVETVLEGSVRKAGNRIRITAQLINVEDGFHLWSERFDRELEDVFAIQDDIAQSIVKTLKVEVLGEREVPLVRAHTENPKAYEAYLRGRFHWFKFTSEHFDIAKEYFQLALERYPEYALAHVGISRFWIARGNLGFDPPRETYPKINSAVLKALELDDHCAEAHESLALVKLYYEWDWDGAEEEFQRAIALNPNFTDAHSDYAEFLCAMKRSAEALEEVELSMRLDPLNHLTQMLYGGQLAQMRRYDDAIAQFRKILKAEPGLSQAHEGLWIAYHQKQMDEEAVRQARKFVSGKNMSDIAEALKRGHAEAGYRGAMRSAAGVLVGRSNQSYIPAIRIALLYAHAQEKDLALDWLEKAFEDREPLMVYLNKDLQWDYLRDDPRFQDLLSRMNFPK